ncbi:MAG TPA: TetR/AcrR family transcriptional regulator [Aquihabitans sp.]|nr:TetR/AcrR family transcriptional regulator [Aquihabitans sp.]
MTERLTQAQRRAESTERLHRAFAELVCEQGYVLTTAAEIGERAGYSRNMVRDRFGSKEALFFDFTIATFLRPQRRSAAEGGTGLDRVLRMVDDVRTQAERDPVSLRASYVIMFESVVEGHPLSKPVLGGLATHTDRRARHLADGIADGSIRPDLDPRTEAELMLAEGMGIAYDDVVGLSGRPLPALLIFWRAEVEVRLAPRATRAGAPGPDG